MIFNSQFKINTKIIYFCSILIFYHFFVKFKEFLFMFENAVDFLSDDIKYLNENLNLMVTLVLDNLIHSIYLFQLVNRLHTLFKTTLPLYDCAF